MAWTLEEFKDNVRSAVNIERQLAGYDQRMAFVRTVSQYCSYDDADDFKVLYADGKCGVRYAVDAWTYNEDDHTLVLVLGDWNDFEDSSRLTKTEAEQMLKRLRMFFELSRKKKLPEGAQPPLDFSTPEYQLAEMIQTETIERVRLLLFTDRAVSERLKTLGTEMFENILIEMDLWGLERLYDQAVSGSDHEPLEIDFTDSPVELRLAASGNGFKSYLGVIRAEKLAQLYQQHTGRLLERNVRSYLMLRTGVNKSIRKTILSDKHEYFFIYNNGIAATAENLEFDQNGSLIRAKDFQIINGGQTTASLARAYFVDGAKQKVQDIQVAIKLTEIDKSLPPEEARELVSNISRYSNNQNKVSDADLTSNHVFHIRMEQTAMRIMAPCAPGELHGKQWFYERNRGSFLQRQMFLDRAAAKAFTARTDKKHVIKKEDLARVRLVWDDPRPDIASKGAAKLFAVFMDGIQEDWDKKNEAGAYGDQYFKDSVSLYIIHEELRRLVREADWYMAGGYLAAIVVYTMAVYSMLFSRQNPNREFNFDLVWKHQCIPDAMVPDLMDIAEKVAQRLTADDRLKQNVTEWAKMDTCWKRIKAHFETGFKLNAFAEQAVRTEAQVREQKATQKMNAEVDTSVDLLKKAMNFNHWEEALTFNAGHGYLTDRQKRAIVACFGMLSGRMPSTREIKTAFEGIERLRDEGFPH